MTSIKTVRLWIRIILLLILSGCLPVSASKSRPKRCQVHHIELQTGTALVGYGLSAWDEPMQVYIRASKRLFPNANTHIEGGCIKFEDSPEVAKVTFCSECRAAEATYSAAWMQHFHPGVLSNRQVGTNIDNAQKTLRQMLDLLDRIRQRQSPE